MEKVKNPRKSRIESTRRTQERQNVDRPKQKMFFQNIDDIDPRSIPAGMEYYRARVQIGEHDDTGRLPDMMRKGWTLVPADRHPEMAFSDPLGRLTTYKGYIYHKGGILCERPIELGKQEYDRLHDRNMSDLLNMPGTDNFLGEPSIPGAVQYQTYVTKNATFGR
jgi:hypothetical protein